MKTSKQNLVDEKKKTFFTRTKSAIFVGVFYAVYVLLLFFSDARWFKWTNDKISFVLNMFNLLLLVPIMYLVSKEITDLCFPTQKGVLRYTVCALFIQVVGVSTYLLYERYLRNYSNAAQDWQNPFDYFLLIALGSILFFTIVSTAVWMFMGRHKVYVGKKTKVWFPLLMFILSTFFTGFFYLSVIHRWTTIVFLLGISTLCDIFAYVGGVNFGKHKMCPKISPKKTWEGLGFGIAVTLVIMCGIYAIFYFVPGAEAKANTLYSFLGNQCSSWISTNATKGVSLQPWFWSIYVSVTLVIMCVSVCGDLFFSWIKRRFNIKDFSNLIPGHGGIMDRLDALIFTFTFYFLITVLIQVFMVGLGQGSNTGLMFLWGKQTNLLF